MTLLNQIFRDGLYYDISSLNFHYEVGGLFYEIGTIYDSFVYGFRTPSESDIDRTYLVWP